MKSRVRSLVTGALVVGASALALGCQVEASIKTKTRYVEPNVTREDTADWDGSPIVVKIEGVGVSINGGVTVTSDPSVTKVRAKARMLAMALADEAEKQNADLSIAEAKNTFAIARTAEGVSVVCGHGGSHGSSTSGESGCELAEIVVPAGDATKPLDVKVLSGNGTLTLQLSNATIKSVGANSNGGVTNADLPATKGGSISLVSESDDIALKLPSDFAADEVILQADGGDIELGPFTDIKNGAGQGGRGAAGTGLALLKVTTKSSLGVITLR